MSGFLTRRLQAATLSLALLMPAGEALAATHHTKHHYARTTYSTHHHRHHYSQTRGALVGAAVGAAVTHNVKGALIGAGVGTAVQYERNDHERHK
jgi:hypothetical protein